jgi:hypothetical protein
MKSFRLRNLLNYIYKPVKTVSSMRKVAIIGAGIFGCTAALVLCKDYEVSLFDKAPFILSGASTLNHLRYHIGFHYPRSPETVSEILAARASFAKEYISCIKSDFPAYYGVSNFNSKTSPKEFIAFCDKMKLPYVQEFPQPQFMNRNKVSLAIKVPEEVYDPDILKSIIMRKIAKSSVKLLLSHELVSAEITGPKKRLLFDNKGKKLEADFDIVINATYTNLNNVNDILGLPKEEVLYELVELLEVRIPGAPRIGLTIMDGEFSSLLPRGAKDTFTLGHVKQSILKEQVSSDVRDLANLDASKISNRKGILDAGIEDFPFLKDAKVVRSIFIPRVVKAHVDATDKRPTEVKCYGNGIYSIFAGKVVTAMTAAEKIRKLLSTTA